MGLRVAGAQLPVTRNVADNVARIFRAIDFASESEADILLTPEGSLSGYYHEFDATEVSDGLELVTEKARSSGIALALGTCFQEADGNRYNQLRFYASDGSFIGFHAKILLCKHVTWDDPSHEAYHYQTMELRTFQWNDLAIGGLICNDTWANPECTPQDDPHLVQKLAQLGAKVIFVSINSGLGQGDNLAMYRAFHGSNLLLRARAAHLWLVTVDAADPSGVLASQAPTGVVSPHGNWVAQTESEGEQMFAYTIALEPDV